VDVLLLSASVLAISGACGWLVLMAWQAPEIWRATWHPTSTPTALALVLQPDRSATTTPTTTPTATPTREPTPTALPQPTATATETAEVTRTPVTAPDGKWIDIDLSEQRLTAYHGQIPVLVATVSTGRLNTPTPRGEFAIYARVRVQDMGGPDYLLPDVQFVAYFYRDYAMHATYWHDNFGQPMSHGCVNLRTADARKLYEWAPIGTPVRVHD
jgi:lipoprotein-anchoring transpeptidase ErfK/SrfK